MAAEVASPKATGGGGTAFEFVVQASFLATMLVKGRYPCLPSGTAEFVRLQARQANYHTDDVFIQLVAAGGETHRLLVQIKSDCAFTEGDSDFRKEHGRISGMTRISIGNGILWPWSPARDLRRT